jgi:DNA-binding Lrp family transcriptional regulator
LYVETDTVVEGCTTAAGGRRRVPSARCLPLPSLSGVSEEIDALDSRLLLLLLRAHPRVGVVEIARRLGVARGTVQARMDKLVARGVITGFGPEVEPTRMGYPVLAFISLEIVQGRLEEAVATLERVPEVLEVHGVTGDRDLLCRVVARDNTHLQDVINAMLHTGAVQRSTSAISMTRQIPYRIEPLIDAAGTDR